jgi:hypothetical protein
VDFETSGLYMEMDSGGLSTQRERLAEISLARYNPSRYEAISEGRALTK